MSLIRRPVPDPRDGDTTSARLAALTARVDQALAVVDTALRAHRANRQLADALLDVRNTLDPPDRR